MTLTQTLAERRRCAETWGRDRCELPANHASHHQAGVLLWSREAPKPRWMAYLRARENHPGAA